MVLSIINVIINFVCIIIKKKTLLLPEEISTDESIQWIYFKGDKGFAVFTGLITAKRKKLTKLSWLWPNEIITSPRRSKGVVVQNISTIFQYFEREDGLLPDPKGPLSKKVTSTSICENANLTLGPTCKHLTTKWWLISNP